MLPLEIVEEIALNLPVKSLLRFSSVSKSWHAMISDAHFVKTHKRRGEGRILISSHAWFGDPTPSSTLPLSSPSSSSAPFIYPLMRNVFTKFVVSCGDMWCVQHPCCSRVWHCRRRDDTQHPCPLAVWNPSMGTFRQLPPPLFEGLDDMKAVYDFSFGMGFDSVGDDYKILKIPRPNYKISVTELYSLRSNSWRKVASFPATAKESPYEPYGNGVFVAGALYWISSPAIICFDLSTEKFAEGVQPPPFDTTARGGLQLAALKGNLCLCLNYYTEQRFVLWEMQKQSSWTKILEIDHVSTALSLSPSGNNNITLTPLHVYDDGRILIKAVTSDDARIFIYQDEETKAQLVWRSYGIRETASGLLYFESLVSPATF